MRRWLSGLLLGSGLLLAACGGESRGLEGETCVRTPIPCGGIKVESCCDGSQCAYRLADGTDFPCDGQDCGDAADQAAAYCANR